MIEPIQTSNLQYLGYEENLKNKEYLEKLNARYDIYPKEEIKEDKVEEIKEKHNLEQKEKLSTADNIPKATKLSQAMTHNVLQNIPTQEIMKMIGTK